MGKDVEVCWVGSSVVCRDSDRHPVFVLLVLGILSDRSALSAYTQFADPFSLTHLDKDIPIPILIKYIRIQNLKLIHLPTAMRRLLDQLIVRVLVLRVFVEELHVGVGRGRVEVVVEFFDVFAVVGCAEGGVGRRDQCG